MAHRRESKFFLSGRVSPSLSEPNLQPNRCIPRILRREKTNKRWTHWIKYKIKVGTIWERLVWSHLYDSNSTIQRRTEQECGSQSRWLQLKWFNDLKTPGDNKSIQCMNSVSWVTHSHLCISALTIMHWGRNEEQGKLKGVFACFTSAPWRATPPIARTPHATPNALIETKVTIFRFLSHYKQNKLSLIDSFLPLRGHLSDSTFIQWCKDLWGAPARQRNSQRTSTQKVHLYLK